MTFQLTAPQATARSANAKAYALTSRVDVPMYLLCIFILRNFFHNTLFYTLLGSGAGRLLAAALAGHNGRGNSRARPAQPRRRHCVGDGGITCGSQCHQHSGTPGEGAGGRACRSEEMRRSLHLSNFFYFFFILFLSEAGDHGFAVAGVLGRHPALTPPRLLALCHALLMHGVWCGAQACYWPGNLALGIITGGAIWGREW
jgi:hypothetical protein